MHGSADTPDEELLRRFAATGDANAFELLLWRHERMVMGVCRRVVRDGHDAEHAFRFKAYGTVMTMSFFQITLDICPRADTMDSGSKHSRVRSPTWQPCWIMP
jgi:hypothetical protein